MISTNPSSTAPSPRSAEVEETYSDSQRFADSYMLAPPPSRSSYGTVEDDDDAVDEGTTWFDTFSPTRTPITPIYPVADAVVVTLPRVGYTPDGRGGLSRRLAGVKWMAKQGMTLEEGVERIVGKN